MNTLAVGLMAIAMMATPASLESSLEDVATSSIASEQVSSEPTPTSSEAQTSEEASSDSFDFGKWMASVFTPEVIASIISVITAIGAILKLVSTMRELAKHNKLSDQHIIDLTAETIKNSIDGAKTDLVEPLAKDVEKILPVLDKFAKIMALAQENTPESRVAILNLIAEIGASESEVKAAAEDAKKVVEAQVKEAQGKKKEAQVTLGEISSDYDGTSV